MSFKGKRTAVCAFYRSHKGLSWLLLLSVAVVCFYLFTLDVPEAFKHASEWLTVAEALALSYIASFIFYLVQVYFPGWSRKKDVDRCICVYIDSIIAATRQTIDEIVEKAIGCDSPSKPYTVEEWKNIPDFNSDTEMFPLAQFTNKAFDKSGSRFVKNMTVRDWLLQQASYVDAEIDRVMSYYGTSLNPRIIECLERIRSTALMGPMRGVLQSSINVFFNADNSDFILIFYLAGERLKKVRDEEYGYLDE